MRFNEAYKAFINDHCNRRSGGQLKRLQDGHGHAEKMFLNVVWWPMFHHFMYLHPEYEVHDYKDGYRYLDFAYVRPHFRIAIEIDGFGPHLRNITTWQFDDHCLRQNHLVIDGWYVIRLTYNQVKEQPRLCQQVIQQLMGNWLSNASSMNELTIFEKEIIRFAARATNSLTPKDVCFHLGIGKGFGQKLLHGLVKKRWLQPAGGNLRIRSYELHPSRIGVRL